jgi:hypothetical protein
MTLNTTISVHFDPDDVSADLTKPYTLDLGRISKNECRIVLFVGTVEHADVLIAAVQKLKKQLAKEVHGKPDCPACFGTGMVHAGKSRPEVCELCFPEGDG